jgi:RNA polymerase sigma-70 factor (ECF subfamily)
MAGRTVGTDTQIQGLIERANAGDAASREALFGHACDRLFRLTRKMFHGSGPLRRWEQTDDIFQSSMLRLQRALEQTKVESVRHFFNLAALQIRRELIDTARKHFGPEGIAANHHTDLQAPDESGGSLHAAADEPEDLAQWTRFHTLVESLPDDEREVVNLLFYESLTQEEAARLLGVNVRTVKRRWQSARLALNGNRNGDARR